MPSYKNQLTEQLIMKSLGRRLGVKNEPYFQIEAFYGTLCDMIKENTSESGFKNLRKFDRDFFYQILQESELIKSGDNLFVRVQSFVINLMRAQIALNEKLKSIHKHIQNLEEQLQSAQQKERPANRFDPQFEEKQNLQKQLSQIKDQKKSTEDDLFNFRITFIQEEQLKKLTQKLQTSKSNPFFKPLQSQSPQKQLSKVPDSKTTASIYHSIGVDKNSPSKRLSKPKPNNIIFAAMFILTLILLLIQTAIAIFYQVSFLNLVVLGFIVLMFVKQKYSKAELKFFAFLNAFSFILGFVCLLITNSNLWASDSTQLFQGSQLRRFQVFVMILASLILKILLQICILLQIFRDLPKQTRVSLVCFSFSIKQTQEPLNKDIIPTTFGKVFS